MTSAGQLAAIFRERFNADPLICRAPGRVNLIGEHTDYNDGFVLPFAIDKHTYVAGSVRDDNVIGVYTQTLDKYVEFRVGEIPKGDDAKWGAYVAGMAAVLQRSIEVKGANLVIDSDIPFGAGLSSSAALEVAVGIMLGALSGSTTDKRDIALAGQKVENDFMGVRSGIMDQFASALSEAGQAILIDCRSLAFENVPLELPGMVFAVADTKVKHSLASSEYNERRRECEEGVETIARRFSGVEALRDVSMSQLEECAGDLSPTVLKRCRHVVTENSRTLDAAQAVRRGDASQLGQLMYASHESLRDDYEVSCPELDLLVDRARELDGVVGSRMTGGGFGGCTITVLRKEVFDEFSSKLEDAFGAQFGHAPEIFPVVPSEGASMLS